MDNPESAYPLRAQSDAFESPIARGIESLVAFQPQPDGNGQSYVRLELGWAEFFYRLEEIGNGLVCSTNGWARFNQHQAFSDWKRIPGENTWIQLKTGTQLNTDQFGSIIVVEQDGENGMMLSIQLIHKNGHGHIKIVLSSESNLPAFYDLVRSAAVPGATPLPLRQSSSAGNPEVPALKMLRSLWSGACHSMPDETYPGCGSLARWVALKYLDNRYVEQFEGAGYERLFEQWIKYQCQIRLTLFHPDHQITESICPASQCCCDSFWHLYGSHWQCHMPIHPGLRFMRVHADPYQPETAWIEIYHEPSRRLLAWIRPEADPIDRMHWNKSLKFIKPEPRARSTKELR